MVSPTTTTMTDRLAVTDPGDTALVALRLVRPAPWNPRKITQTDMQRLTESVRLRPGFLWDRPALVQLSTGHVYGGNMRYRSAVRLAENGQLPAEYRLLDGTPAMPMRVNDVSDSEAQQYAFLDNNQFGDYEATEAGELLASLRDQGVDLDSLGFSDVELKQMLDSVDPGSLPGGEGTVEEIPHTYSIIVECGPDERRQRQLLERLTAEGLKCRALQS